MALTKYERWAKAKIPKTIHCVRLGDHFIGKMFELLTINTADLFPLEDAKDFTAEAWIDSHDSDLSIMSWDGHNRSKSLKKGEYFMVLDAISLTKRPLDEDEIERLERERRVSPV